MNNENSILTNDFNNIRFLLEKLFIYGCFTRTQYVNLKYISSEPKYDKEIKKINNYLSKNFHYSKQNGRNKIHYIDYDKFNIYDKNLLNVYRYKTFSDEEIYTYIYVLLILKSLETKYEKPSVEFSELWNDYLPLIGTGRNYRRKIDELVEKEYLVKNNNKYKLNNDLLAKFSNGELKSLYCYLDFLENTSPFSTPYSMLKNKIKLYLKLERNVDGLKAITQYSYSNLVTSLDNEILYNLLIAKHNNKPLNIIYFDEQKKKNITAVCQEIIIDVQYGRQFVFVYDVDNKKHFTIRLDMILNAVVLNENYPSFKKMNCDSSWNYHYNDEKPSEVVIEFTMDEHTKYLYGKVRSERKHGVLSEVKNNKFTYTIKVKDPIELAPWIRSFGKHAKVIKSKDNILQNNFKERYKKALENYGII